MPWAASRRICRRFARIPPATSRSVDGWALRAAISSAPRPIRRCRFPHLRSGSKPAKPCPAGCDCVIDADLLDQTGPIVQALGRRHRVRAFAARAAKSSKRAPSIAPGRRIRPLDLLIARAAGLAETERAPSAAAHRQYSRQFGRRGDGAADRRKRAAPRALPSSLSMPRDAMRHPSPRQPEPALAICSSPSAAAASAAAMRWSQRLARRGEVIAHGIALQPGRTAAVGRIGTFP